MTLEQIYYVSQTVAVFAILGSLFYLNIQVRDNARAARATSFEQIATSMTNQWDELSRNPELCSLVLRGGDDFEALDRVEKARLRFFLMARVRRYESAWFQHEVGILKAENWHAIASDMEPAFTQPGFRAAWRLIRLRSSPKFRVFVDAVVASAETEAKAVQSPT